MEQTFLYVEDYIEFIAGWRTRGGKLLGLFENQPSPLSLARYDVQILSSMGEQTAFSQKPYTDKQAALAVKIVTKYRKQLLGLPAPVYIPEVLDNFRLGIRQVDRSRRIYIKDNSAMVRFPFDGPLIAQLRELAKHSQGECKWNPIQKVWQTALTEFNINYIVTLGLRHEFDITDEVLALQKQIRVVEQTDYRIELVKDSSGCYTITNAAQSLREYLEQQLGDHCWTDLIRLCDLSEVCGYTISTEVEQELVDKIKPDYYRETVNFITSRKFGVAKEEFKHVLEYARLTDRLPMYYYDPSAPDQKDTEEVVYLNVASRDPDLMNKIKLLVTHSSLLIGNRRRSWAQNAEKIIELL